MGSSALTLLQTAQQELGLFPLSTTIAATDDTTVQMVSLLNRVGIDVRDEKEDGWTSLQGEYIVNVVAPIITTGSVTLGSTAVTNVAASLATVFPPNWVVTGNDITQASRVLAVNIAGASLTMSELATGTNAAEVLTLSQDTYQVPPDFVGFINRTQWDRSRRWELRGPESPQEDQWIRSGIVATGPRRRFRQVGRTSYNFRLWPPPTTLDSPATLVFEYRSSYWVTAADGVTGKPSITLDSDTANFPDDVMVAGLKYYFFRIKGFDTSALEDDFKRYRDRAMARDGGRGTLSMSRRKWPIFISPANIPDTGFGNP